MAVDRVPMRQNPKLFDRVIQDIQRGLADRLPWLDYSFGRAERLVKEIDGRRYYTPNVYTGRGDYELVLPDSVKFGNYSFFVLDEPQDVTHPTQQEVQISTPFSLIVWVDMRKVGDEYRERNTESVKEDILLALQDIHIRKGWISVSRIYERAENVFAGFTLDEVQNQFMMAPYAGFRFYGQMTTTNDCMI